MIKQCCDCPKTFEVSDDLAWGISRCPDCEEKEIETDLLFEADMQKKRELEAREVD